MNEGSFCPERVVVWDDHCNIRVRLVPGVSTRAFGDGWEVAAFGANGVSVHGSRGLWQEGVVDDVGNEMTYVLVFQADSNRVR